MENSLWPQRPAQLARVDVSPLRGPALREAITVPPNDGGIMEPELIDHPMAAPSAAIEHHAIRLVSRTRRASDDIAALLPIRGAGRPRTVSAEVHDRGLQLAHQVQRFGRPPA